MYQEEHGFIHNRFLDTKIQKVVTFGRHVENFLVNYMRIFVVDTRDAGQWSDPKVEPLWITATKQVE